MRRRDGCSRLVAGNLGPPERLRGTTLWCRAGQRAMVARELIVLAAREFVVLVFVLAFVVWLAVRFVRESRR